jgi:diguanylate cyclase (GGDEF)-like protein
MSQNKHALKLLNHRWGLCLNNSIQCAFFNSSTEHAFRSLIESFVKTIDANVYRFDLVQTHYNQPFSPYMEVIQHQASTPQAMADLLERAAIYQPHRSIIESYTMKGKAERREPLILDELDYEQFEMQASILSLLGQASQERPIVIAISHAHYSTTTAIKLLTSIREHVVSGKLLLCLCFDSQHHFVNESDEQAWEGFISYAHESYSVTELPDIESFSHDRWPTQQISQSLALDALSEVGRNNLEFLCLDESLQAVQKTLENLDSPSLNSLDSNNIDLYITLGRAFLLLNRADEALEYFDLLLEHAQISDDNNKIAKSCLLITWGHIRKYDLTTAEHFANQAVKFAKQTDDKMLQAICFFALYYVYDRSTQPMEREKFTRLIERLDHLQFQNHLAFCYRNYYVILRYDEDLDVKLVIDYCNRAININKAIGNRAGVAAAYQSKGIIYSYQHAYHKTLRCLKVSEQIRTGLKNPLDIIRIRNGIGYFYNLIEDYPSAQRYFNSAFGILRKIKDYGEVAVTLYNFSWLYYCAHHFEKAITVIEKLLKLMRILKIHYIPFRNLYDIYTLKGLCHIKQGEILRAQQCVERINQLEIEPSRTCKFLYAGFQALLCAAQGDPYRAEMYFTKAPALLGKVLDIDVRMLPYNYTNFANFLFAQGRHDEAVDLLESTQSIAQEQQMPVTNEWLSVLKLKPNAPLNIELPDIHLDLDNLVELAEHRVKLDNLHKRVREITLINTLQLIADKVTDSRKLIEEAVKLINSHFCVELGCVHLYQDEQWKLYSYFDDSKALQNFEGFSIDFIESLNAEAKPIIFQQYPIYLSSGGVVETTSFVNLPLHIGQTTIGNLFLATISKQSLLNNKDLEILSIISTQLANLIDRFHREATLQQLSTTDSLTKLNNRQALQAKLEEQINHYRRYPKDDDRNFCLLFMDLDNFKFFNDTFGHEVGDELLILFARLLQSLLRKTDFVARYGGDEFVAILCETQIEHAKELGQRINQALLAKHSFKDNIDAMLGENINIPDGKQITCSIGITSFKPESFHDDSKDILREADQALYLAKERGKNQIALLPGSLQ